MKPLSILVSLFRPLKLVDMEIRLITSYWSGKVVSHLLAGCRTLWLSECIERKVVSQRQLTEL